MGLRIRKSISIGKTGVKINFSKSGVGASAGVKGIRATKLTNGRTRTTFSLPETGITYVKDSSTNHTSKNRKHNEKFFKNEFEVKSETEYDNYDEKIDADIELFITFINCYQEFSKFTCIIDEIYSYKEYFPIYSPNPNFFGIISIEDQASYFNKICSDINELFEKITKKTLNPKEFFELYPILIDRFEKEIDLEKDSRKLKKIFPALKEKKYWQNQQNYLNQIKNKELLVESFINRYLEFVDRQWEEYLFYVGNKGKEYFDKSKNILIKYGDSSFTNSQWEIINSFYNRSKL